MNNKEAQEIVRRYYLANKEYFNKIKNTYKSELKPRELILVQDAKKAKDISRWQKLQLKWQGPFRIKRLLEKGFYKIKDLNNTKIGGTLYGNWLKRFRI